MLCLPLLNLSHHLKQSESVTHEKLSSPCGNNIQVFCSTLGSDDLVFPHADRYTFLHYEQYHFLRNFHYIWLRTWQKNQMVKIFEHRRTNFCAEKASCQSNNKPLAPISALYLPNDLSSEGVKLWPETWMTPLSSIHTFSPFFTQLALFKNFDVQ